MQIISSVDHASYSGIHLALITPVPENADLHQQLLQVDDVHPVAAEDLTRLRLGHMGDNKRCFALVDGDRQVLAAIYTYAEVLASYRLFNRQMPDNVALILEDEVKSLTALPNRVTFYSVLRTSELRGAGTLLIKSLRSEFTKATMVASGNDNIFVTLSPLRTLAAWARENAAPEDTQTHHGRLSLAGRYLATAKDGVQNVHMGNGASIADIHVGANHIGSIDDKLGFNVMVNYDYSAPPEQLEENRRRFKAGQPVVAPHLRNLVCA